MNVPRYPEPLHEDDVPASLRGNTLVRHLLSLTPEDEAALAKLAAEDAAEDEHTAAEIVSSVR